jgi:tetratricopeptide (TPR) repeat protein
MADLIAGNGWTIQLAERLRGAARVLTDDPRPEALRHRVDLLEEAAKLTPENARLRTELAVAHLESYRRRLDLLNGRRIVAAIAGLPLSASTPDASALSTSVQVAACLRVATTFGWQNTFRADSEAAGREHLRPALRNLVMARDVCPLLARPHVMIASHIGDFQKADPRRAYLDRAKLLASRDPALFFLFGVEEFADGQVDQACANWRRSLELADTHLASILALTSQSPDSQKLLERVLPERPEVVLGVALRLYPAGKPSADRQALLERALRLARERGEPTAEDLELQGRILRELGRRADAVAAYRQALEHRPRQLEWRCALALLLCQEGAYNEAREELRFVLALQPSHPAANKLLRLVTEKQARGE